MDAATDAATRPRLTRDTEHGEVAGVCAGLGARFGVDPVLFRIAAVTSVALGGLGLFAYAVAWVFVPRRPRTSADVPRRAWTRIAGLLLVAAATIGLPSTTGLWWGQLSWPLLLAGTGLAVLYGPGGAFRTRTVDSLRSWWTDSPRQTLGRAILGAALILSAAVVSLQLTGNLVQTGQAVVGLAVVLLAVGLVLGPWLVRLLRSLGAERAARIRSQERAEVAAHLHDSVLQTLALIQRRTDDPKQVATLARRQERELRGWLAGDGERPASSTLVGTLEDVAAEVEDTFGVSVEVVAVGDRPLDERGAALVAAAREAMVNAARFGQPGDGPAAVSVFAEAADAGVEVFVRDRGPGFDPDAIPADRRGVRESIIGRMERHGGSATILSVPGAGTEIVLRLPGGPTP